MFSVEGFKLFTSLIVPPYARRFNLCSTDWTSVDDMFAAEACVVMFLLQSRLTFRFHSHHLYTFQGHFGLSQLLTDLNLYPPISLLGKRDGSPAITENGNSFGSVKAVCTVWWIPAFGREGKGNQLTSMTKYPLYGWSSCTYGQKCRLKVKYWRIVAEVDGTAWVDCTY